METKRFPHDSTSGLSMRNYNITNILFQYVVHERSKIGRGDESNSENIIALYPSEYNKQIKLTTKKRMELSNVASRLTNSSSQSSLTSSFPLNIIPREIIFQQFNPGNIYTSNISVSNTSKVSHFVKLICEPSETFYVDLKGSVQNIRLAPGMSHTYKVQFCPHDKRDYEHQVNLVGNFKTLNIPIIALGPRAILNFPDRIMIANTPVNISSTKTILVENIGDSDAVFTMSSSNLYFSIEPSCGVIKEHDSLQFIINFTAPNVGSFSTIIYLKYEKGELLRIDAYGTSFNCDIKLDIEQLLLDDTFIGLSSSKSIKIYNDSDYVVKFMWLKYMGASKDNEEKKKLVAIYNAIEEDYDFHRLDLNYVNSFDSDTYKSICERVYTDNVASLDVECLFYRDRQFLLSPIVGEISPRNFMDITVNFQPKIIGEISSEAYLEIMGRETRIPLKLIGTGLGPILRLNTTTIDIGRIYFGSTQNFEIVCANKGLIPGVLISKDKSSDFGGQVLISPQQLEIQPGEYSSFNLSFSSTRNGEFIETVEFLNQDNSETLLLYIKGYVISPTLCFDQSHVDFGVCALGFTHEQEVTVRNVSSVPVTFSIIIPEDGDECAITYETFINIRTVTAPISLPSNPREFSTSSNCTTLPSNSSVSFKIYFTPNIERNRRTYLEVIIEGCDTVSIILPIIYEIKVASYTVKPSGFNIRSAYINFPYTLLFTIENTSDVEGVFYFLRESTTADSMRFYSMSRNQWHLKSGQSVSASLTIITRVIGRQEIELKIRTLGKETTDTLLAVVNGQGPVLSVIPKHLDFGDVELLQESSMSLHLINNSPIPANFKAYIVNKNSPWIISVAEAEINPMKTMKITATLFLRDTGNQSDKILIVVANSSTISITLCAHGFGSPIKIHPNIFPDFNIGQLLSHQDNFVTLNLTNESNRWQKLIFSNTTTVRNSRSVPQMPSMNTFNIEPHAIDLPPRTTKEVNWLIHSDTCDNISEQWWVYGAAENETKHQLIGISNLSATFVEPTVKFSKNELNFYINVGSDEKHSVNEKLIDELEVTNVSQMNLKVHFSIRYPFFIISENGERVNNTSVNLDNNFVSLIRVCFAPNLKDSQLYSVKFVEPLKSKYDQHPNRDKIKCKGTVNYPNIIPIPRELQFDTSLCRPIEKVLLLSNDGPIPANYKLSWVKESIHTEFFNNLTSHRGLTQRSDSLNPKNDEKEEENNMTSSKTATVNEFSKHLIDQMFKLSCTSGTVLPYSTAEVSINFQTLETICLSVQLLCQVSPGPAEYIKVTARADEIKYIFNKTNINFGNQSLFKLCQETIDLTNTSKIEFLYKINIPMENRSNTDGVLTIIPMEGSTDPGKITQFKITYRSRIPGVYEKSFNITIGNSNEAKITVKCTAVFPQVYLHLPSTLSTRNISIEDEYNAINDLHIMEGSNLNMIDENANDFQRLMNTGWEIISRDDEIIPKIMDLEMIIEKYAAVKYINENITLTAIHILSGEPLPIPLLFSTTYELNLGYVVIGQYTNYSTAIINYSPVRISIRMKNNLPEKYLTKYGIRVNFRNRVNMIPSEFITLDIGIHPLKKNFPEQSKVIRRKIYLEVINGCTIPIKIVANVTEPWLTINTNSLNFGHVSIGNCKMIRLFIKNTGLINCQWKIIFFKTEKKMQMQFQLNNYQGNLVPGESGTIDIYFRPRKSGYFEAELNIVVHEGLQQPKICLIGRGIEKKLKIEELSIEFLPTTPYSIAEVREFNIKNAVNCPVEFYWQHLDHLSVEEDRVIKILLHYYQVDELLLPSTDSGVLIPQRLYDFYNALINEMIADSKFNSNRSPEDIRVSQVKSPEDDAILDGDSESVLEKRNKEKSFIETRDIILKAFAFNSRSIPDPSDIPIDEVSSSLLSKLGSREDIEKSLHEYIDKLHENAELFSLKTDPLKEILDEFNAVNSPIKDESDKLNKQVCIIFHGAPFTQYQETACRVGRILDFPVINLDTAITEMIALGESSNSVYLRQMIDDEYEKLLQITITNNFDLLESRNENETKLMNSIRIDEIVLERFKKNIHFNLPEPEDVVTQLRNFPSLDEINCMEPLCLYEYKIEGIHLLQNIVETASATMSMTTNRDKLIGKKTNKISKLQRQTSNDGTFLDINLYMFEKLLQEIFNNKKYDKGFILQKLDNNFIRSVDSTLSSILHVIGGTESMKFVTFHNSLDLYKRKFAEKQSEVLLEQQKYLSMRLKMIDEMSASEFELLSEHEKNLFLKKVLRPRINEAQERRMKFKGEYKFDKSVSTEVKNVKIKSSKKDDKHRDGSTKKNKKQKKSESMKQQLLTEEFMNYEINLNSIERIIKHNFHIWHVKFTDPWNSIIYDTVINQIMENQLINKTLIDNKITEPVFESQLYTIVSNNSQRREYQSGEKSPFKLIQLSHNIVINSASSIDSKAVIEEKPHPRITLESKESKTFRISFEPTCLGSFTEKLQLSIVGVNNKTYQIDISGMVDIPHLKMDPIIIFNRVEQCKQGNSNEPRYFIDKEAFDFGYLLITDKDNMKKIHQRVSQFNFFNSSSINVNVEFYLAGDNREMFHLLPRILSIKPNEFGTLQVTATALRSGLNTDRLLLIIKNNPRIEEIILECFGCKLDVELSNKNLSFGRILLLRKEYKSVILKNKSAVPVFWKILSQEVENPQIIFSTVSDWVDAFAEYNIEICYHGQRIGRTKQSINIGIFFEEYDVDPLLLQPLTISGETYDVAVDVNDANPIEFKIARVGKIIKASFSIKNCGGHDINFIVELGDMKDIYEVDHNLMKNLREDFHIDPPSGCLLPNKKIIINVKFTPKIELDLKQVTLLKCNLLDTNIKPTIIAELPLTVTIHAEYNKFNVEPYQEVFFGPVSIATHKEMPFYIKNIGIFPLRYQIVGKNINDLRSSSIQSRDLKKKRRKNSPGNEIEFRDVSKTPKKKKSIPQSNQSPQQFGIFTLKQHHEGALNPNQVEKILFDCYSETEDHFESEVLIYVDNCSIDDQNGRKLKLSVDFIKPKINFVDLNSIFQHSHIVNNIQDFNCPSQIKPLSIFTKDEMCLHFERVIISTTHTVKLKLSNTSLVPAEVSLRLQSDELEPKNSPTSKFTLDPLKLLISPLNSEIFTVSFTPTSIETYTGILEAFVDLPSHIEREKFTIKLSGEGFVAEIILIQPEIFCKRGHASLEYGKCLIGETLTKSIRFKNVGKISAKVTAEILEDLKSLYEFKTTNVVNHNKVGDRCIEVSMKPGEVTELSVLFTPKAKGKYEAHVRLLIVENPYECLMINLNGQGFIEFVILSDLQLFKPENVKIESIGSIEANHDEKNRSDGNMKENLAQQSPTISETSYIDSMSRNPSITLIYILELGGCFLKEERESSFMIINKSPDKTFRFEWSYHENFIIKPSTGHLHRLHEKNITVTFIASETVLYHQIPMDCAISEIEIIEEQQDVSWDDQNMQVDWIESPASNGEGEGIEDLEDDMKKIVYAMDEPIHEVLSPTYVIKLLVSASASHATYSCLINEINFGDTFMLQRKKKNFEIKNSGKVNLNYYWKIHELSVQHSDSSGNNSPTIYHESISDDSNESQSTAERLEYLIVPENNNLEGIDRNECKSSFEIEPAFGTVFSDETKIFTARFSPNNAGKYCAKFICNIENLDPEVPPLTISISGTGIMSYYHFELPPSNYLSTREGRTVPQDVTVIEFKVIGTKKNYIKHFNLMNPTTESFHFSWIDKSLMNSNNIPYFHCKSQNGIAESGKKTKITFTLLACKVGIFEALWSFFIHEYNLEVPFLLIGIVKEPQIICCTPKITIPSITLGVRVHGTMIIRNNEDLPLKFRIIDDSVFSEGKLQYLSVEPMSGILPLKNDHKFIISYRPSKIGEFSFILQCRIERMKEPLECYITANVFKIQSQLIFSRSSNERIKLEIDKINVLDLGKLMLKNITTADFEITNMTNIAVEYEWNLNSNSQNVFRNNEYIYKIKMGEVNGFIEKKSRIISTLEVTAMKKFELKNHPITLKIIHGPLYKAVINASAKQESIEFSFNQFDFGACYVREDVESASYNVELCITNNDDSIAIVGCNNVPLPFIVDLQKLSHAIPGRTTACVLIEFYPLEMKKYHATLIFMINGNIERKVHLKGEGINYKVGLINPREKFIDFGNVLIGKNVQRRLTIINSAKVSVKLKIGLIKKSNDSMKPHNVLEVLSNSLRFEPAEILILRPNKPQNVVIKFSPMQRITLFEEKIGAFCTDSATIPLSFIRGRCIAPEFNLNRTQLLFNTIIEGFSKDDKLILHNSGDIGSKFKWNIKNLGPHFTLKPLAGYSAPGKNITFNVCFNPIIQSNVIKGKAVIELENYKNIAISFIGSCSKRPDPKDIIKFSINVRSKQTKNIDVRNNTDVEDRIEIFTTGNYFQSEAILLVGPNSLALCSVTYAPLLMTEKKNLHKGTLVMKFSRRNYIEIYALEGTSLPPEAIAKISRGVPAKIKYIETLPVYNWLNEPQCFNCSIEMIGKYEESPIYTFNASDKIEILANGMRNYEAVLCCYKGSILNFKISFTNHEGEYQFYEVEYNIIDLASIETIELTSTAQKSVIYSLKIENPLNNESVTYSGYCPHSDIKIVGLPKVLAPRSEDAIAIHYSPMIASEFETTLNVISTKLGEFPYKLKMKATPPEKICLTLPEMTTPLGCSRTFSIVIKNSSEKVDEFTIAIDNPSFTCQMNKIFISARDEDKIELIHEPYDIGVVQVKLIVSSIMNSEIIYEISGNGTIPKPQGPFILKPDQPVTIPFKNVFMDTRTFKYIVDPTVSFATSSSSNEINSKQTANITVEFRDLNGSQNDGDATNGNVITGKLIIYCTDPSLSSINWIYYLRGVSL